MPSEEIRDPSSSTSFDSSSYQSRSRSSSKKNADLQLSNILVEWVRFGTSGRFLSIQAKVLLQDLRRIGKCKRIISKAVKAGVIEYMKDVEEQDLDEKNIGQWFFASEQAKPVSTVAHVDYYRDINAREEFDRVVDIERAELDCRNDDDAKSRWNNIVHCPLLQLALRGLWRRKEIWFKDITTARIGDASLLPEIASKAKKMQSKMVDFAMVIRSSPNDLKCMKVILRDKRHFSINQIDARYMRFMPITLSIELKREAIGKDTSNTQLVTWVSAHFTKLEQLNHDDVNLSILLLVMVQGRQWEFMIAQKISGEEIVIFRDHSLGSIGSILGVYQLLKFIRRLVEWTNESYRRWFDSYVLDVGNEDLETVESEEKLC